MQDNHEMMELNEYLTDAEIVRAIRYLDPDFSTERTEEDAGTALEISRPDDRADRRARVYRPLRADALKMRVASEMIQTTWRTVSWLMTTSTAAITIADATTAARCIGLDTGLPTTTSPL
jgi:hypothetical protein